jgi:hypothetical protein
LLDVGDDTAWFLDDVDFINTHPLGCFNPDCF